MRLFKHPDSSVVDFDLSVRMANEYFGRKCQIMAKKKAGELATERVDGEIMRAGPYDRAFKIKFSICRDDLL